MYLALCADPQRGSDCEVIIGCWWRRYAASVDSMRFTPLEINMSWGRTRYIGDDTIICSYDIGTCSIHTCVHYCAPLVLCETVCCVEVFRTSVLQFLLPSFLYIMCAHTYTYPVYWLRLVGVVFKEIQCLLNFHYDNGCQCVEIYPCITFCLPLCFPVSVIYAHAIKNVLAETFLVLFSKK